MQQAAVMVLVAGLLSLSTRFAAGGDAGAPLHVVTATLNGVQIACDTRTGGIVTMTCPGVGKVIDVPAGEAGIGDLACPVPDFEPLRLAPRFSQHAEITKTGQRLTIHWGRLGASRVMHEPAGRVAATVTFEAAPDGRSVTIACQVDNQSEGVVRQILFPDFLGLLPLVGETETEFRGDEILMHPFVRLAQPTSDYFYAVNRVFTSFPPRGKEKPTAPHWFGYGGPRGGLVIFPRRRAWHDLPMVMLHLWERNHKLRIMVGHDVKIGKDQTWQSETYSLTPFTGEWTKGTEPYREWVRQGEDK
ncbi:MAG: hypothetical protein ACC645_28005 [Pirellulales bacterium]